MNTEQHIDPEVIEAVRWVLRRRGAKLHDVVVEELVREVSEKLKAQADPEGQEYAYAYRVCTDCGRDGVSRTVDPMSLREAREYAEKVGPDGVWVERALLGTWRRVG